ncbi:sigma factor-like helix-turn-helix DNA-binding protein [Paenibacillus herberti]|uniref:RNA polymerase sigma factor 70 region 4 type 2 domain-containing protein n=1 Tax=Paenibacillus herberti TaxID=1619309 RepID=A0A229P4Z3_9BACL|nr:sigma factor-like helix-turn-helix DNA-binding protein [Paenibacillus herberti]OXM17333.1 hypothetical protein CGZ75_12225 [Paenibacillus herberti]
MAIGPLYTKYEAFTIMNMGPATADNYRRSRKMTRAVHSRATDKAERRVLAEMVAECDYVIDWLETGRRPGSFTGAERAVRVQTWDPSILDSYSSPNSRWVIERDKSSRDLTDDERFRIEEAMRDLSQRERQCYMLNVVDGMTFEEISRELHVGRSSVQKYIERAREKIENTKMTSLFLLE